MRERARKERERSVRQAKEEDDIKFTDDVKENKIKIFSSLSYVEAASRVGLR